MEHADRVVNGCRRSWVVVGALFLASAASPGHAQTPASGSIAEPTPSFRDVLSLARIGAVRISPDGSDVGYVLNTPDWERNGSRSDLWLSIDGEAPTPLAAAADMAGDFRWTPDGRGVAILAREEGTTWLRIVPIDGGPERRVGPLPPGAGRFELSPEGDRVVVLAREPASQRAEREQELYGPFDAKNENLRPTAAWLVGLGPQDGGRASAASAPPQRLTGEEMHVRDVAWAPDGRRLAIEHQPDPRANTSYSTDISVIDLESGAMRAITSTPGRDGSPVWSPDGDRIAYLSHRGAGVSNLPLELLVVPAAGGAPVNLTESLATEPRNVVWSRTGIWFLAEEGALVHLHRVDPDARALVRIHGLPEIVGSLSVSAVGTTLAIRAESRETLAEAYRLDFPDMEPIRVTDTTAQVEGWPLGSREVVAWTARDGTRIEGVLFKPDRYDPARRYPLLVVVHGGPRAASRPVLAPGGVYPILQWVAQGALVLQPNYRGSTGYGPEFRVKHHRTLGSGDAIDVAAGVQHLVAEGLVDPERVGLMGWSYGGFISAYLTATSDLFRAVSVGAGISDWRTHYAWEPPNITTRDFSFGATPWDDPAAYDVASPITYIRGARTPTLIQHVDGDPTVPVMNAYELYQGLLDVGVETRFIEYRGTTHGVSGLRQVHGALWHNWQWFARHLWGEDVEIPLQ